MFVAAKRFVFGFRAVVLGVFALALACAVVTMAQDPPPSEKPAEARSGEPQQGAKRANTPSRAPVRRGTQKSRPNRPGVTTPGQPPSVDGQQPQPQPAGQPADPGHDAEVQKKIDELLRRAASGDQPDPELQRQIDELLRSQAVETGGVTPGTIQQPQADPAQPPADAPRPDARELARQRAEERRKQLQQQRQLQQQQPGSEQPGIQPPPQQPQPMPVTAFQPSSEEPAGPTTQINIPPMQDATPPEERTYSFAIKNGTYEQLIAGFARQTGLGVVGEAPQGGPVSFVTTEQLSFKEALSRIRMLLFNYKPHEPYWLLRNEDSLQVVRVTDLYRIIPADRVFRSLPEYRAANLSPEDIALVFLTPTEGTIADYTVAKDFVPDYVRLTPIPEQNRVAIFAVVKDIERYLEFVPIVAAKGSDPRSLERIELKNISATDALSKLGQLMPLDAGMTRTIQRPARPGRSDAPMMETIPEPAVNIIPDDSIGALIVYAMPDKILEIKKLLAFIDVDLSMAGPGPVVVKLKHTRADEIIPVLQQMLTATSSPGLADPNVPSRPPRRTRRPRGTATPTTTPAVSADSVALVAHPSGDAIIVMAATDTDLEDVNKLIALVDVPNVVGWTQIPVQHANAEALKETALTILGESPVKPEASAASVFVDPSGMSLWFSGSPRDLERMRDLVSKLDVPGDEVRFRSIQLEYQQPSFVANMLREIDGAAQSTPAVAMPEPPDAARAIRSARRLGRQNTPAVAASKFTAVDETQTLWVLCTESEWARYLPIIQQLDSRPTDDRPPFVRLPVQHVSAEKAVDRLSAMIGGTQATEISASIRLVPAGANILVIGATEREIELIEVFLAEADQPAAIEQRIFEIRFADPAEIKTAIETLAGGAAAPVGGPRTRIRPRVEGAQPDGASLAETTPPLISDEMTILQMGSRLVVRATPAKLDEIESLIADFDVQGGGTEIKVYDKFRRGADIESIADTITSILTGSTQPRGGIRTREAGGAQAGPRLIAQPASGRLIAIAQPADFPRIEELLEILRFEESAAPFVVDFIPVRHADPADLVESIEPVLAIKVRGLVKSGELAEPDVGIEDPNSPAAAVRRLRTVGKDTGGDKYHIAADPRNRRIVAAAPQVIIDELRKLVEQFDIQGEAGEIIFRTLELTNASPTDMIRAIKEMFGKPSPQRISGVKRGAAPQPAAAAGAMESATGESLTLVEAPGASAIILHGVKADVEQATEWIRQLDAMSAPGRIVKVYSVAGMEVGRVFDLLVNVVDSAPRMPAARGPAPAGPRGKEEAAVEEEEAFATTKTYTGQDLYIQADLIGHTMLVAATAAKIAQIDGYIRQFETNEEIVQAISVTQIPKFTYKLQYADDSYDAKLALEDVLDTFWDTDEKPKVEAATFGNLLIIRHPDESKFPEIRDLIVAHVDKRDPEKVKLISKTLLPPEGFSAEYLAKFLGANLPGNVSVIESTPKETEDYGIEEVKPQITRKPADGAQGTNGHRCVLPLSLMREFGGFPAVLLGQNEQPDQPQEPPAQEEPVQPEPEPEQPDELQDELIREAITPTIRVDTEPLAQPEQKPAEQREPVEVDIYTDSDIRLIYNPQTGEIRYEGPAGLEEVIQELIDELKKEEVPAPPDIRIVRVRYIDVYSAQDIIEEMFNATRQQRQEMLNMQQQQMRMQQQQQRIQQQQAQRAQRGRGDEEDEGGPQRGGQNQQQQPQMPQAMPQLPPTTVRVYPNPRDRTLILRADTSQYPQIFKLLSTIDQPKPFDSLMRVYALKKLNAKEVEEILKQMLGLDVSAGGGRGRARAAGPAGEGGSSASSSGPGGQLPETILQPTRTGTNTLGVDPEDIKLFASEASNSIMAMAPLVALDYIGTIISNLETGDIPQRLTKYYELAHAEADNIVDYLTAHFAGQDAARARAAKPGDTGVTTGGGAPNAPSFIAYQRLNLITVQATEPQIKEIDEIIARLDVETTDEQWRDIRVVHVDAAQAADILTQMFGGGGAAGSGPGRPASSGAAPRFIGEPGGGIVLFSAPENLRQEILDTVAKLEEQHKAPSQIRVITLKNVAPSGVAEALTKAYETGRAGPKGGPAPKFTVTAHDASRQLFVKAPDEVFAEIHSLIQSLDQPGELPEFRIYKLKHANAKAVHGMMSKLLMEYMQRLGQNKGALASEPFSVQPDEASNSLIVLGGPIVFGFVEENLRGIDTPDVATGPMVSVTVPLTNTDVGEVAQSLTRLWSTRGLPPELVPTIDANRMANTLVIRATQEQITEMKAIVEALEKQGDEPGKTTPIRTFPLKFADPAAVAEAIGKLFRPSSPNPRDQVQVTADYGSNSVIVSAAPQNIKRIEDLLAQIDTEVSSGQGVHVLEIKHADPQAVAQSLNEVYIRGAQQPGRPGGQVGITIAAVPGSQAVVVRAKGDDLERIKQTILQLDTPEVGGGGFVRVVTLLYADAVEVNAAMQEYLRKAGGARGGQLMGDVRLSPMPTANGMMIAGAEEEVVRLEGIIKAMDIAGEKGNVPQIIQLKWANASLLVTMLQEVFTAPGGTPRRGAQPPVITSDPTGEFLVVRAAPTDLAAIEQMVANLDTEDRAPKEPLRIVPVKAGIDVENLAEKVESAINDSAKARAGSAPRGGHVPSITAQSDSRTNTITISGHPALFADAETMIKTLEGMGPAGAPATRIMKVNIAQEEIQKLIDQLTRGSGEERRSRGSTGGGTRPPRGDRRRP